MRWLKSYFDAFHPSLVQVWIGSLLVALLLLLAAAAWGYQHLNHFVRQAASEKASYIVNSAVMAAESIHSKHDFQRLISSLSAERDVKDVIVVAGEPARVIAASRLAWLNLPLSELPDAHYQRELTEALVHLAAEDHLYAKGDLDMLVPIKLSCCSKSVNLTQGLMMVVVDSQRVLASGKSLLIAFIVAALVVLLFLMSYWFVVWWRLVWRPVDQLRQVMQHRYQGELVYAPPMRLQEFSALGDAYNQLLLEEQKNNTQIQLLNVLLHQSGNGLLLLDEDANLLLINRAAKKLLPAAPRAELGESALPLFVSTPAGSLVFWQQVSEAGNEHQSWRLQQEEGGNSIELDVRIHYLHQAQQKGYYLVILTDVSEQRAAEANIRYLLDFDNLTRLHNLEKFKEHLRKQIELGHHQFAVVMLDVDRFKQVNEALGHTVGDQLLVNISQRLVFMVRAEEKLARMSGDEFILCLQIDDRHALPQRMMGMLDELSQPVTITGHRLNVSVSMGVSVFLEDADNVDALLAHADVALYRAKAAGRRRVEFFKADGSQPQLHRLRLEADLRQAIYERQLLLHYQPQLSMATGEIIGVEALIRWQHPALGMISPADFIPLAEETGLIASIGDWVLRTACQQVSDWEKQGIALRIAVNVSVMQFNGEGFSQRVQEVLQQTGLRANQLELELTESIMALSKDDLREAFLRLKALGVQLAIDDFGTGFSSLSYLNTFPIDRLKIDQEFVRAMLTETGQTNVGVVKAVIELANVFGLSAIAEGVETIEQLTELRRLGCEEYQGFLCSRPLPAEDFVAFYQRYKPITCIS